MLRAFFLTQFKNSIIISLKTTKSGFQQVDFVFLFITMENLRSILSTVYDTGKLTPSDIFKKELHRRYRYDEKRENHSFDI